ncbi:MAG: adenosylcobinamide-phosphate synthase [Alphaproteobacteria bacterium]|jgi:adenosylcobinamide-phosphate synthase
MHGKRAGFNRLRWTTSSKVMFDFMPLAGGNHSDAIVLLLAALALDFLLGKVPGAFRFMPAQIGAFSNFSAFLENRLNRSGRSDASLVIRGIFVVLLLLTLAIVVGMTVIFIARTFPYGWVLGFVVLALCISSRLIFYDMRRGQKFAASDDLDDGRHRVGELTGRDASQLDKYGLARVIVETGAVGVLQRTVVPIFWFVLLGFPGLLASRFIAQLAGSISNRDHERQAFGTVALALNHAFGLLPSLLAGYLLAVAALFVPSANFGRALQVM